MQNKTNLTQYFIDEINIQIETSLKAKKRNWSFKDSVINSKYADPRNAELIKAIQFIQSNPLRTNDYYKFVTAYSESKVKLNTKYFRHDLKKLEDYYCKVDENPNFKPFNERNFEDYVLFMTLKLTGHYESEDNELFNVIIKDSREYNPLSKIPSVLRGNLPFKVKEFDIKRAFPTFIDIELDTEFRNSVYEIISKTDFAICLNSNSTSKVSIEKARKGLEPIYKEQTNNIITDERFNQKGKAFKDFAKYEAEYINKFVRTNKLKNYARLHDGIFVLHDTDCTDTKFDKVEFSIKECIKPKIEYASPHLSDRNQCELRYDFTLAYFAA